MHHGEKLKNSEANSIKNYENIENIIPNYWVNPLDVNPIVLNTTQITNQTQEKLLEMEEFRNLEPYLSQNSQLSKSTHELNTPIFDKEEPFDFTTSSMRNTFSIMKKNIAFKNSTMETSNNNNFNQCQEVKDIFIKTFNGNDNSSNHTINFSLQNSPTQININLKKDNNVREDQTNSAFVKFENYIFNDQQNINNTSSNYDSYNVFQLNNKESHSSDGYLNNINSHSFGIETPDDSNSSKISINMLPKLELNLDYNEMKNVPNTPDVIDTVVSLHDTFNILDYVDDKDVSTVNIEDIPFEISSTSTNNTIIKSSIKTTMQTRKKQVLKKYNDYDDCDDSDDEDYVPPSSINRRLSNEVDSDSNDSLKIKKSRRGRPRRLSSISSEHSDITKYRELRDKNNEASRRSRLKRKMKEKSIEDEAEQLNIRNIKLKAQVGELEKLVNNFRNNLFKIMLKK